MPQDFSTGQVLTAAQMDTLSGAVDGYATTATSAGTTTLTTASLYQQFFTGSTTHSVVMPVTTTLYIGQKWRIRNKSSGIVTVKTSDSTTIYAVPAGSDVIFTCILASGTTAASWDYKDAAGVSGALTKILAASFSAVATTGTSFDGVFTSTYNTYIIIFEEMFNSIANQALQFQTRLAAVTTATAYYGTLTTGVTLTTMSNTTSYNMGQLTTSGLTGGFTMTFYRHQAPLGWSHTGFSRLSLAGITGAAINDGLGSDGADGFILSSASGNISGRVTVYGVSI